MRAWQVEALSDPGRMRLAELPVPTPAHDQYLVKVEAAGLNFLDTLAIKGRYQTKPALPFTPGVEVVGTIVSGEGAGTRVACATPAGRFGGFAEYALVPRAEAMPIASNVAPGAALALRGNYPTSLYALRHAGRLQAGETLLVHAGAGGVGSAAVQLGKLMGARVIATAGSAAKRDACLALGADATIDYTDAKWVDEVRKLAPQGVDVIYDPVGGDIGAQSVRCLAFGARLLVIGFASGALTPLPANRLLLANASAVGVLWGEVRKREPALARQLGEEIQGWYLSGRIRPLEASVFDFEDAPAALAALERRQTSGKAILLLRR
ncbi:NADPH:quinone oxidoreductase family protein [Variovorax sp. efr-133-TYG-130]|uniref:NADPH:quinone oxidoreductase family protein n=1 Tax=Variovorax sp. efr-133-TYG-130 TaxID=3040327 RepID=UPI0025573F65|nr:NADPH:quinone oxidoreductase family protein [Variovorax sp. efr-133-TYG-130]